MVYQPMLEVLAYLRSQGFTDVTDLLGGYGAWEAMHATATA